jgi:hypothetical protein
LSILFVCQWLKVETNNIKILGTENPKGATATVKMEDAFLAEKLRTRLQSRNPHSPLSLCPRGSKQAYNEGTSLVA